MWLGFLAYITSGQNWLDLAGNTMVLLVIHADAQEIAWIMVFLIWLKAIHTLRIFESQRNLIMMILACLSKMIPFLTIVVSGVFMFALIKF